MMFLTKTPLVKLQTCIVAACGLFAIPAMARGCDCLLGSAGPFDKAYAPSANGFASQQCKRLGGDYNFADKHCRYRGDPCPADFGKIYHPILSAQGKDNIQVC